MRRAISCLICAINLPVNINEPVRCVIGATLMMAVALGIGRFAYTPLLPDMVTAYGWTFAQSGDVASANFLGYTLGAILAARSAQSAHARLWLAVSLMASMATTAVGLGMSGYLSWLALRFAAGVASAFCLVLVTTHLIQTLARHKAQRLGNVHFAGVGVGIILCLSVLDSSSGVNEQWATLGATAAFAGAIAWIMLSGSSWVASTTSATDASRWEGPHLWRVVAGYGLFGYGYVVSATFVVAMADQLDIANPNLGWWCVGFAIIPSVYLWQWVANRVGLVRTLIAAYGVIAFGTALVGLTDTLFALVIGCVMLGGTFAAITALGLSAAQAAEPRRVGYAVSVMTTAFAIGQLLGPSISGRMADFYGDFAVASLVAAGLLVVAAGLLVQLKR